MNYPIVAMGFIIEIFVLYKYWFSVLEPRFSRRKTVAWYFLFSLLNAIKSLIWFENMTFKGVSTHIILFVVMCILFKDDLLKKTVVYVLYLLCIFIAETLSLVMAMYVYKCDPGNFMEPNLSNFLWSVTTYVLLFICTVVGLIFLKRKKINSDSLAVQYIYLYGAIQIEILSMLYMLAIEYKVATPVVFAVMTAVIVASFGVGIFIYKSVLMASCLRAEAEYLKKESELKSTHFDELKIRYAAYRRLRHDMYNHIRIINEMEDSEKLKKYVADVKNQLEEIDGIL